MWFSVTICFVLILVQDGSLADEENIFETSNGISMKDNNASILVVPTNAKHISNELVRIRKAIDQSGRRYCDGNRQSPIDIVSNDKTDAYFVNSLEFNNYNRRPGSFVISNDDDTIKANAGFFIRPSISGGPLEDTYVFDSLHFHYGEDDTTGGEHELNGNKFPMEMHVVHRKMGTFTTRNALQYSDGLAVVGYWFSTDQDRPSPVIDKILKSRPSGLFRQRRVQPTFPLDELAFTFSYGYYTYVGSLTTGSCTEVVTWIIPETPIQVSKLQMNQLRAVFGIPARPSRTVTPLNGRKLFYIG